MAYVRRKGNQLAVVHGTRDPETNGVEQQTLFSLYSKAEALAAVGDQQHHFRHILETEAPGIRFDWPKIEAGIRDNLEHLPDLYSYKKLRVEDTFRTALCEFARELILADPQTLMSSARLLQANRHELAYLRDLIDWRLKLCDQDESKWNQDNPFYWRTASHRREVPPDEWEKLAELYQKHRFDEAEALARLLTECWPNFARGYNYLGLIEMEREHFDAALEHFDEAMRVGRTLFPKRIRKELYWQDHSTRPYIRAIVYKAQALNRLQRYDEALLLCDRLDKECGQDITAATERVPIYLNSGLWKLAISSATYVHKLYPDHNFPLAFGLLEDGDRQQALVHFLHATIKFPRAARMMTGVRCGGQPKSAEEIEDHHTGVTWLRDLEPYLRAWSREAKAFFKRIVQSADVVALIDEARETRKKWRANRGEDRTWFDRMQEMESLEFARGQAERLGAPAK